MNNRERVLEYFRNNDSGWQERAEEGIERYRKGAARLVVVAENGNPISNAKIKAVQKGHEFRFGANLLLLDQLESQEKNEKYKKYFSDVFNMATVPFYWNAVEPEKGKTRFKKDSPAYYRRPPIDLCLEFCNQHGIEPREHAIGYDRFFPEWLYGATAEETKAELERHYKELGRRYADKFRTVEVTNEMEWTHGRTEFYDAPDYVEWCFKTARKYFPNNQLVINEHQWLAWVDRCRATDKYYAYIEANMLKGAEIDAIGFQYHMFHKAEKEYDLTREYYNPNNLYRHMDLYAGLKKPLQVTEITIPCYSNNDEDEAIQAEILENLYKIWFSHPNMEQIIYWNLVDGYAHVWTQDKEEIRRSQGNMTKGENVYYGGLIRFDMTPKPAYYKIKELIEKTWHTETVGITDNGGAFDFRGFYGDYELEIEADGKQVKRTIKISSKSDNNITVTI